MINDKLKFTVVILTYNREKHIRQQISSILKIRNCEIIIVDNCSDDNYVEKIKKENPSIKTVTLEKNYGAVGRNFGIAAAEGEFIITLDDDVYGLTEEHLLNLEKSFKSDNKIACICFKVIDEKSKNICNWCHPKDPAIHSEKSFETYNISEGAAAFRKAIFNDINPAYPWEFFISHEGPDLAYRILNKGYKTLYVPTVEVIHAYAVEGRKSWRRYYFDTRNVIWLAYRNYPYRMIFKTLPLQLAAMFVYSARDGFLKYFFKGVWDAILGLKVMHGQRSPLSSTAYNHLKLINAQKPSLLFYLKNRLFKKGVKI